MVQEAGEATMAVKAVEEKAAAEMVVAAKAGWMVARMQLTPSRAGGSQTQHQSASPPRMVDAPDTVHTTTVEPEV